MQYFHSHGSRHQVHRLVTKQFTAGEQEHRSQALASFGGRVIPTKVITDHLTDTRQTFGRTVQDKLFQTYFKLVF